MASQYGEDEIIKKYFGDKRGGRYLDLGAYDGRTFSNTFALAERGWSGICVEASPQCFIQLQKTFKENPNIVLVNVAIGTKNGCTKFYDNGGAVASLDQAHYEKWKKIDDRYQEIHVGVITPGVLLDQLPGPYDFISIDLEGSTLNVVVLFPDLKNLGVKLVCIEAYTPTERKWLGGEMEKRGYCLYGETEENQIYEVR